MTYINGQRGNDKLFLGSGEDEVFGGQGNDFINAVDRSQDLIGCGQVVHDRVRMNPGDDLMGIEDDTIVRKSSGKA